jgi:hypothetical protein
MKTVTTYNITYSYDYTLGGGYTCDTLTEAKKMVEDFKNNEWLVGKAYLLTKVTYKKGLFGKKKNLTVERIEGWAE